MRVGTLIEGAAKRNWNAGHRARLLRATIGMACRLSQWSVIRRISRTRGGEREYLHGYVYGDSRWRDGTLITTSVVVWRDNHEAMTASGHRYELAEPSDAAERTAVRSLGC